MAKLTKAIQVRFSPEELAELDKFVETIHRRTGGHIPRVELIRQGVKELIEREMTA